MLRTRASPQALPLENRFQDSIEDKEQLAKDTKSELGR